MKKILYYSTEQRFAKVQGTYYGIGGFSNKLWDRYLEFFDELVVIARVTTNPKEQIDEGNIASKYGVRFIDVPYFIGPMEYLKKRNRIHKFLDQQVKNDGKFLCRLPSTIGSELIRVLNKKNISYSVEVVGNPWDVFAPGSIKHPLRPFLRFYSTLELKCQIKGARAALYVTENTLQKIYPPRKDAFSIGVSDVIINENTIPENPKTFTKKDSYLLISIGTLDQLYKGPDILLKAIKKVNDSGVLCNMLWLGDGKYKSMLQNQAVELGISDYVNFAGSVPGDDVILYLRKSDLFALVSRTEGLPRVIIEAMGQGLPCIGSKVGGIPELLPEDSLVPKEDVDALAKLIIKMITNENFYNDKAIENLQNAHNYTFSKLNAKRKLFFEFIKNNT